MTRKRVAIVGGGFAGLRAVRELSPKEFDVTLIDSKDCFEYVPEALRCMVEPQTAEKCLVPYPAKFNFKQGVMVGISSDGTAGEVQLQGGEAIPFDYALLATGSSYPGSVIKANSAQLVSREKRLAEFKAAREQLAAAGSVVIVGGGTVGVELAAEVAETWPDKKVILVNSGPRILERMPSGIAEYAQKWLEAHGVEVLCGERIADWGGIQDTPGPATLTTSSGKQVTGDYVIRAVGQRPATACYAASLSGGQLAANGAIQVDPTLQVAGMPNVFAAGDVNTIKEEKTAYFADLGGMVAAHNIGRLARGEQLQTYPEGLYGGHSQLPFLGGLSLGRRDGAFDAVGSMQTGPNTARTRGLVAFISQRAAAGSWLWGGASNFLKSFIVRKLTSAAAAEQKKKEAAGVPAAAVAAA